MGKNLLGKGDINTFLTNLDKSISGKVEIFLIGGGAMALKKLLQNIMWAFQQFMEQKVFMNF